MRHDRVALSCTSSAVASRPVGVHADAERVIDLCSAGFGEDPRNCSSNAAALWWRFLWSPSIVVKIMFEAQMYEVGTVTDGECDTAREGKTLFVATCRPDRYNRFLCFVCWFAPASVASRYSGGRSRHLGRSRRSLSGVCRRNSAA